MFATAIKWELLSDCCWFQFLESLPNLWVYLGTLRRDLVKEHGREVVTALIRLL